MLLFSALTVSFHLLQVCNTVFIYLLELMALLIFNLSCFKMYAFKTTIFPLSPFLAAFWQFSYVVISLSFSSKCVANSLKISVLTLELFIRKTCVSNYLGFFLLFMVDCWCFCVIQCGLQDNDSSVSVEIPLPRILFNFCICKWSQEENIFFVEYRIIYVN